MSCRNVVYELGVHFCFLADRGVNKGRRRLPNPVHFVCKTPHLLHMPENASLLPTLSLRTPVSNLWCECFIKAKFRSTDVPGKKQKMTQQGPWP